MPNYLFEHPETGEQAEVFQSINEEHRFIDNNGIEWRRVFVNPQVSIDTQFDPLSSKDFVEKTRNKRGTLGEIWNKSKELGEKRKEIVGKDMIAEKYYQNYSSARRGKKHDDIRKEESINKLNKMGVDIE